MHLSKQGMFQEIKKRYIWILLYAPIYLTWFSWLEKTVTNKFHMISTALDSRIPFLEYFIVPYLLWFPYVAVTLLYLGFADKAEYIKLSIFLVVGMTIFLLVSTIYPNGHYLRPVFFERDNIFTDLVKMLYQTDTSTNVFPSIHVYNSIGVNIAIWNSEKTKSKRYIKYGSMVLMISIILSTMFLKQHSIIDVVGGIILSGIVNVLVEKLQNENLQEENIYSAGKVLKRG